MLSTKSKVGGGDLLGYLHGSSQVLSDRLEEELRKTTEVSVDTRIQEVNKTSDGFRIVTDRGTFDSRYVVNTIPLTIFAGLKKNFEFKNGIDYQGAVCGIFLIKQPLTKFFWLNILDDNILFKALVNQSVLDDYPGTLIYCINYIPATHPLFQQSREEIMGQYLNGLNRMFGKIDVLESQFFKTAHATPIFDIDYGEKMAELDQCIPGMFFAGNVKIYPYNRVISNVIGTGCQAAEQIASNLGKKDAEKTHLDFERYACT